MVVLESKLTIPSSLGQAIAAAIGVILFSLGAVFVFMGLVRPDVTWATYGGVSFIAGLGVLLARMRTLKTVPVELQYDNEVLSLMAGDDVAVVVSRLRYGAERAPQNQRLFWCDVYDAEEKLVVRFHILASKLRGPRWPTKLMPNTLPLYSFTWGRDLWKFVELAEERGITTTKDEAA